MHDANHRSYAKKAWVNKIMSYTLSLLGGFSPTWQYQHNTLHHGFTNIDGYDEDINPGGLMRFCPGKPRLRIHKFQHLYAWFLYGLMTVTWTVDKDFRQLYRYSKSSDFIASQKPLGNLLVELIITKILYYTYILLIPILVLPVSWWLVLVFYFSMHFVCGFILGIIFQTAHVVPSSSFPVPSNTGAVDNNWAVHQLTTTANYSAKSGVFSWLIGGLNYQVEHHLFPHICHVHYKKIAPIVERTAKEFGLPYHQQGSFVMALFNHYKMLKKLGCNSVVK